MTKKPRRWFPMLKFTNDNPAPFVLLLRTTGPDW